jgi:general secretion pathway protein M
MNLTGLLDKSRLSFSEFWTARDTRERAMLSAAALAVVLGLTYLLLIEPALAGRNKMHNDLPHLRQQVAHLQALTNEAKVLSAMPAPAVAPINRKMIDDALSHNGIKPKSLIMTGDYAKVQLAAVSFASTLAWLDEMQRTAMLAVVDANIAALAQADLVDATLTLRQARNE